MTDQEIDGLIRAYLELCPAEPISPKVLEEIETILGVVLPADLKKIGTVFSGDSLELEHFAFKAKGDYSVVEKTLAWRSFPGIPPRFVALGEMSESFVVLETTSSASSARVLWCDAIFGRRLADREDIVADFPDDVDAFDSYAAYFAFMIEAEREDRKYG